MSETKSDPTSNFRPSAAQIGLRIGSGTCTSACDHFWHDARRSFADYFLFPEVGDTQPRLTPAVVPVSEFQDYAAWVEKVGKNQDGNRRRLHGRAVRKGFYVKPFPWKQFIGDIVEINHSKEVRSGGKMTASYQRSLEEMGGFATSKQEVRFPQCMQHWALEFGVFGAEPGRTQGDVQVDERLYGYVAMRRYGEIAIYSMILGHGDFLNDGIMILLHDEVIRWLREHDATYAVDLRYVMYGADTSGGKGLMQWKRWSGFHALDIDAVKGVGRVVEDACLLRAIG